MYWKRRIYIGTSGWSYDHWRPAFYPADLPDGERLAFYAERFPSVEINSSFYRLPREQTLERWKRAVPKEFRFSVKASRYITHMKKLREPADTLAPFFERMDVLDEKLGPILFQLPPRWRFDPDRLAGFLEALDGTHQYAFEFRDPSWQSPLAYELLAEYRAALCIFDLDGHLSPLETTSDLIYLRLHGPDGPYRGKYSDDALADWSDVLRAWAKLDKTVYCYFDNDQAGYAAENAGQLQENLDAA